MRPPLTALLLATLASPAMAEPPVYPPDAIYFSHRISTEIDFARSARSADESDGPKLTVE